jgi:phosphatidylserine decarboxylase
MLLSAARQDWASGGVRSRHGRVFARNQRVVCLFETPEFGPCSMGLVGATIVGSMGFLA